MNNWKWFRTKLPLLAGLSPWVVFFLGLALSYSYRGDTVGIEVMSPRVFSQIIAVYAGAAFAVVAVMICAVVTARGKQSKWSWIGLGLSAIYIVPLILISV